MVVYNIRRYEIRILSTKLGDMDWITYTEQNILFVPLNSGKLLWH